jgi:hypothetical protein
VNDWFDVRNHAIAWARSVARELNTIDLWAELERSRDLALAGENEANNEPFDARASTASRPCLLRYGNWSPRPTRLRQSKRKYCIVALAISNGRRGEWGASIGSIC